MKKLELKTKPLYILFFAFFASYFVLENLRITVNWTTLALSVLVLYGLFSVPCKRKVDRKDVFLLFLFAALLAIANNLGSHIHIEQSPYTDLREQSYLTDYDWSDAVGVPVMIFVLYQGLKQALCWIPRGAVLQA